MRVHERRTPFVSGNCPLNVDGGNPVPGCRIEEYTGMLLPASCTTVRLLIRNLSDITNTIESLLRRMCCS